MKKIILALLLVLSCLIPNAFATPSGYGVEVTEVDGSPLVGAARIAFPNGTVSCTNGICTLTLAGAGDFLADGTVPMTGDFSAGGHDIGNALNISSYKAGETSVIKAYSSGGAKSIGFYHDDTNGLLTTSSGNMYLTPNGGLVFIGATNVRSRERIELTADTVLTAAQSRGTFVTNQGSSGEIDLTLYALSEGATCTLIVEEAQIIELCPPAGELFDLDGTDLDANDCVDSPAVVGAKLVATRMKIASGAWRWSLDTVRGSWTDTGASD